MPDTPNRDNFITQWRERIRATLPEVTSQIAKLGAFGIVAASIAILANDPTLASYSGFITGLAGNFIASAVERLRNAPSDQDRDILLQQIADEVSIHRDDSQLIETLQLLDLQGSISDLGDKLDGIEHILTELVNSGFVSQTHINAQGSHGFLYQPKSSISQTFISVTHEASHYTRDALHQLRPIPPSFTGRKDEVNAVSALIRADLTHGQPFNQICCIHGMPGVGKTDFANVVAHSFIAEFPDGQLFIELGSNSPLPVTSAAALSSCIRLLARDPKLELPEDAASLRTLFINHLQGKRVLILLDDARDDEHVAPLLPPDGCAAIITSRHTLATGVLFELALLSRPDSVALLSNYAPRLTPSEANTVAELCGDLPIALTVAGGYLKTRRTIPVSEYIDTLRGDERLQHLGVERTFDASYRALTHQERIMLNSLSIMPADFDRAAGLAVGRAEITRKGRRSLIPADGLDNLVAANLLQYDELSQRFRWHDLLRDYVRARTPVDVSMAAAERHATYYLKLLRDAETLYLQGGESISRGMSLFDREWQHIKEGQAWATQHLAESSTAAHLTMAYSDAGSHCLQLRLHPLEWIQWLDASLTASRQLQNRNYECAALGNLGNAYHSTGNYTLAIEYHQLLLTVSQEIRERYYEGSALGGLGRDYFSLGDYSKAIDYQLKRLDIVRENGDLPGVGSTLGDLGSVYDALADYRQAISCYQQSLEISNQTRDLRSEVVARGGLGNAFYALGEYHKAIAQFRELMAIANHLHDHQFEGSAYGGLGNAYHALGEYISAINYYMKWLEMARLTDDRRGEATALGNLGNVFHGKGDYQKAIDYHTQRLAITRKIGDRHGEGQSLGNLGMAYFYLGDLHQARKYQSQFLTIARSIGDRRSEGIAIGNLGGVHCLMGDFSVAVDYHQLQLEISRQIGDRQNEGQAYAGLGHVFDHLGDYQNAEHYYQQSITIAHELGDRRVEATVSWYLGLVYGKTGNLKRAVDSLQILVDFEQTIDHLDAAKHSAIVEELRSRIADHTSSLH